MNKPKPGCPRCHAVDYKQETAPDGRPLFRCHCGHSWTCGRDGGEYVKRQKETP